MWSNMWIECGLDAETVNHFLHSSPNANQQPMASVTDSRLDEDVLSNWCICSISDSISHQVVQSLTGHGNFDSHLFILGLVDSPNCLACDLVTCLMLFSVHFPSDACWCFQPDPIPLLVYLPLVCALLWWFPCVFTCMLHLICILRTVQLLGVTVLGRSLYLLIAPIINQINELQ